MTDNVTSTTAAARDTARFVPNPEIVAALGKGTIAIPREACAFLLACSVESMLPNEDGALAWPYSWSQFDCLFGFVEWKGSLATFPEWGGAKVGDTVTHAAGVWQDEPATYAEIAALTDHVDFSPAAQIANNWVLAVRDFKERTGNDLLLTLQKGELSAVSPGLSATWPEGCDANFPARYAIALAEFPAQVSPPAPAPRQPSPPPPMSDIEIPVGLVYTCNASMTVKGVSLPLSPGILSSSNPGVCSITISDDGNSVTMSGLAVGQSFLQGSGTKYAVSVVEPRPDTVMLDLKNGKWSRATRTAAWLARSSAAAVVAGCLLIPVPVARDAAPSVPSLAQSTFYLATTVDGHIVAVPR